MQVQSFVIRDIAQQQAGDQIEEQFVQLRLKKAEMHAWRERVWAFP